MYIYAQINDKNIVNKNECEEVNWYWKIYLFHKNSALIHIQGGQVGRINF